MEKRGIHIVALMVIACLLPLFARSEFQLHVLVMVLLYALLAQGWNVMTGYTGLISIGQAAFFGFGAYVSSLLFVRWGINPWLGMLLAAFLTSLFSMIVFYPVTRLKGRYFAIATIAVSQGLKVLFENWEFVEAARGLAHPIVPEGFWAFQFHSSKLPYYYILLALVSLITLALYFLENSRLGYYFQAIRENEDVASAMGINKTKYKLISVAISGAITSIAGSFLAQYSLYVEPEYVFAHEISVTTALTGIFGGIGHLAGPILGSLILTPLSEYTRAWLGAGGTGIDMMIYGGFIVIICVVEPKGVVGLWGRIRERKVTGKNVAHLTG
ncbi:MAG: branched-chain amino acid ABC transporter permease [Limnochordia bacterium]|jgi:branched-chain amino acid transport system permease protein